MRVLVMGCGNIGRYVAHTLAASHEVHTVDPRPVDCPNRIAEIGDPELKKFDVVVGVLPSGIAFREARRVLSVGVPMVDVAYYREDPMELAGIAESSNVAYVPDAGLAPGLSNMFAGMLVALGNIDVRIYVGGVPERPVGPLGYIPTWNVEDLLEEYTRDVRIIRGGKVEYVEPLTGLELVDTPFGTMEAFYTDGLRTMLTTLGSKTRDMFEKTLRWPGHADKVRLLLELGLLRDNDLDGCTPRKVMARLMGDMRSNVRDLVYMKVAGDRDTYEMWMRGNGWTAMQAATGTLSAVLIGLVRGLKPGIWPVELLADRILDDVVAELRRRGAVVISMRNGAAL